MLIMQMTTKIGRQTPTLRSLWDLGLGLKDGTEIIMSRPRSWKNVLGCVRVLWNNDGNCVALAPQH